MLVLCGVSEFLSLYYMLISFNYGFMLTRIVLPDIHVVSWYLLFWFESHDMYYVNYGSSWVMLPCIIVVHWFFPSWFNPLVSCMISWLLVFSVQLSLFSSFKQHNMNMSVSTPNIVSITSHVLRISLIPNTHHPSLPPQHHIQASHLIYSLLCVSHLSMTFRVSITQEQSSLACVFPIVNP